ncbi:DUF3152 domain-containing protein [Amycolatopsis thermophila]|uniref:DUF3152 domain-containing protein n=1 Tax=Amycolatopsis thermophila TaxID=206084 RepID=A0ABU0EPK0_9PSEU|nr:DUF3152 domain-containing protein [Amycolatopsis thermophila]MDQ0377217.1 hypothetical protein [Amycolatopsis thermophila]
MNRASRGERGEGRRTQYAPSPDRSSVRLSEDRYRPRSRRVQAEPLAASWKPPQAQLEQDPEEAREARRRRGKVRRLVGTYGWRVYALPVLVVITVLVAFNTAGEPAPPSNSAQSREGVGVEDPGPEEQPAPPRDLNIPTAELPTGGGFTQSGAMAYHVVPVPPDGVSGKEVGSGGTVYHYTIEVENGIDPSSYAGDDAFASAVERTLSDVRSWIGTGKVKLQRVGADAPDIDFRVSLTTPDTAKRPDVCGFDIQFPTSCYSRSFDHRVVINLARWVRGALAFTDLGLYRQYAINHEVGHALGNSHVGCKENGALAPVMMQQTFGVSNDYVAQLNSVDKYNSKAVPADGKTCVPNAWPVLDFGDKVPGGG